MNAVGKYMADVTDEEKDAIATVNKQEDANFSNNAMAEAFKAAKGE